MMYSDIRMNFFSKTLFLFAALYSASLNASAPEVSEGARFLACLKPSSDPVTIQRMLDLLGKSKELDDLIFDPNNNKRPLIRYVEKHQEFKNENIAALYLEEDEYNIQICEPRNALNIQGLDNLDQAISTLEGIIRLQKQHLVKRFCIAIYSI